MFIKKSNKFTKLVSLFIIFSFFSNAILPAPVWLRLAEAAPSPSGVLASSLNLPKPTQFVPLSTAYSFPVLKGLRFDPADPLKMEFIIDTANKDDVTEEEASQLIRYFLAGLTIPEDDLWVNLSPYEKDRIIAPSLARTDLGEGLLSQDYLLKQISASLTYPESQSGKDFWAKTYEEVLKIAKTTDLPVNTFNKIWILPESSTVYEDAYSAFITEAKLKAMMEEDFLALRESSQKLVGSSQGRTNSQQDKAINKIASSIMRSEILPKINQDINSGKNFAALRQIYYSLILASWFKDRFKESLYSQYINQGKLQGIEAEDQGSKDRVYNLYVEAFKKGLYNYIKPEKESVGNRQIKRRYFSGGITNLENKETIKYVPKTLSDGLTMKKSLAGKGKSLEVNIIEEGVKASSSPIVPKLLEKDSFTRDRALGLLNEAYGKATRAKNTKAKESLWYSVGQLEREDYFYIISGFGLLNDIDVEARSFLRESYLENIKARENSASSAIVLKNATVIPAEQLKNFAGMLVNNHGLKVKNMAVLPLKGKMPAEDLLKEEDVSDLLRISIFQALGSVPFVGGGSRIKEVADSNAVQFTAKGIREKVGNNPSLAIVIMGDEGQRDKSVSLDVGSIYYSGYENSLKKFTNIEQLKKDLEDLKSKGIRVLGFVGDALEVTNGVADKEANSKPTNSWSLFTLFDNAGSLVSDMARIGGVTFNAPTDGGVGPFDLPSVALPKIAQAKGFKLGTPEFDNYLNRVAVLTLGPREETAKKDYEKSATKPHRHQEIINDARLLQKRYPGLRIILPGDGTAAPGAFSVAGISIDGYDLVTFGRSGSNEAKFVSLVASLTEGGQYPHSYVSSEATSNSYSEKFVYNYIDSEREEFANLGISPDEYMVKGESKTKEKGILALTSVTGASADIFGKMGEELFQRANFMPGDGKSGELVTNTFLMTRDGSVFAVRTNFSTDDLDITQKSLIVSREAKKYAADKASSAIYDGVAGTNVVRAIEGMSPPLAALSRFATFEIEHKKNGGITVSHRMDLEGLGYDHAKKEIDAVIKAFESGAGRIVIAAISAKRGNTEWEIGFDARLSNTQMVNALSEEAGVASSAIQNGGIDMDAIKVNRTTGVSGAVNLSPMFNDKNGLLLLNPNFTGLSFKIVSIKDMEDFDTAKPKQLALAN